MRTSALARVGQTTLAQFSRETHTYLYIPLDQLSK